MNFNLNALLSTGDSGVAECRSLMFYKNIKSSEIKDKSCNIRQDLFSKNFISKAFCDGFALFEAIPTIQQINGQNYYTIESGDYYGIFNEDLESRYFFLDEKFKDGKKLVVDKKNKDSGVIIYKGGTGVGEWENYSVPALTGEINDIDITNTNDLFDNWDVFFTGRRVNIEDSGELDNLTGLVFAYQKQENLFEVKENNYDIFGTGVLPKQSDFYIKGLKYDYDSFLEINTGVTLIRQGVASKTTSSEEIITEFNLF